MTTYLSRIRLNPTRRGTRKLVASPQAMHAVVMGSHADLAADARVLWRLDMNSSHDLQLYVVSPSRPDFTGLVEQAGWPTATAWDTTAYDRFLTELKRDQRWRFRLTANPVRSIGAGPGERGKVVPHVTARHQLEWLSERAPKWGFDIATNSLGASALELANRHTATFGRTDHDSNKRGKVAITQATYDGELVVTDAATLRNALVDGMGRAKAYGCGLMTLAPAS